MRLFVPFLIKIGYQMVLLKFEDKALLLAGAGLHFGTEGTDRKVSSALPQFRPHKLIKGRHTVYRASRKGGTDVGVPRVGFHVL